MHDDTYKFLRANSSGVSVEVKLVPKASRNAILGIYQERLKIALTAPPVEGAANEALISFLARLLGVSKRQISIVRGAKDSRKVVHIEGIGIETFLHTVGF